MAYDNTPHVGATYDDGALKRPIFSTQPKVLIIGTASSGLTDERFDVSNTGNAEVEFGSTSEVCKGMHEALAQGADNISIMRVGGKLGSFVFTDSASNTLTITPSYRDDEILERYALFIENDGSTNRIIVYDLIDQAYVYDSNETLVLDEGIVDVVDTGIDLFTVNDLTDVSNATSLADLVTGDFTVDGVATATSAVATEGADGQSVSLVEKYAALNRGYLSLDFEDADYVVPKGVYFDDQNIVDGDSCNYFKGVPVAGSSNDTLGYVWQYFYQGQVYTYFVDSATYFTTSHAAATKTINTDLVFTAQKSGTGGNSISVAMTTVGGTGSSVVTISEPTPTSLLISIVGNNTVTNTQHRTAINTALGAFTMSNGKLANTIVLATSAGSTTTTIVASTPLTGGTGGHVLTHQDLTGDPIPSAVSTAFSAADSAGSDSQLREVNFAHQLATFCYRASTTWKAMQGAISVKEPTGFSKLELSEWVGSAPVVTLLGQDQIISAPADNGTGILGKRLMVGKSVSSDGYRSHMIEGGTSTNGYLYGGLIMTRGLGLPNSDSDYAYGIDDGDELLDSKGAPVDIGKHIHITIDWPIHRNGFDGGTNYRGSAEALLVGVLSTMKENEEPIGQDHPCKRITSVPKIHASQRDLLSKFRYVNLRFEPGIGYVFNTVRTAAHKIDSDYTRSSTIRCVNRIASGIRTIGKKYIGKAFNSLKIQNLQSDIDQYLKTERGNEVHQGAAAVLSYTATDRILGKLKVRLQMVPPFTIEIIDVEISLAAEEADLA